MASKVASNKKAKQELVPDARMTRDRNIKLADTFQSGVHLQDQRGEGIMPARYAPTPSAMDRAMALRSRLVNDQGVVPGIGVANFDERTSNWLMDKAALAEKLRYDQTFAKLFKMTDHANRDKMMKLYPEFAKKRIEHLRTIASIQVQLAMIHVTGPQTKDDLDLIIGIANAPNRAELLEQIETPVHLLWRKPADHKGKAFLTGYFSPFRLFGGMEQQPQNLQVGAGYWMGSGAPGLPDQNPAEIGGHPWLQNLIQ